MNAANRLSGQPSTTSPEGSARKFKTLVACVVGLATGYSAFVAIAFGLFVSPLEDEFGWTRTEVSLAFTVCTYLIVLLTPLVGAWMDRHGVRPLLIPAIGIFGMTLAALALQNGSLWLLYGTYAIAAIAGSATLPPGYSRVIVGWFSTRRGLALSIALSGVGISAIVLPPLLEQVISRHGWRTAYVALSAVCLFVSWPLMAAWFREPPTAVSDRSPGLQTSRIAWLLQTYRDRTLLRIGGAALLLGGSVGGVLVHLIPLLAGQLGSQQRAAFAFSMLGISTLVSRVACGWLLDRFRATKIAFLVFLISAAGIIWLGSGTTGSAVFIAVLMLGVGFGADFDVISYVISRYLPLDEFGRSYGLVYSTFLIGLGAGPALVALGYDAAGNYAASFLTLGIALFVAGSLFGTLGPYRQPLPQS